MIGAKTIWLLMDSALTLGCDYTSLQISAASSVLCSHSTWEHALARNKYIALK